MSKIHRFNAQAIVELTNRQHAWSMENDDLDQLVWEDGSATGKPTHDQILTKAAELQTAEPIRRLRVKRNQLLAETDWMATGDRTISDEWKTYRQSLRDLPANTSDPANPTWPTKPS